MKIAFALFILLLIGVTMISCKQPNLVPATGELRMFDMSLEPAKYEYSRYSDLETVKVKFTNLANRSYDFDMGDGNTIKLKAGESIDYEYRIKLDGSTIRIPIKKMGSGTVQSGLILKIVRK